MGAYILMCMVYEDLKKNNAKRKIMQETNWFGGNGWRLTKIPRTIKSQAWEQQLRDKTNKF